MRAACKPIRLTGLAAALLVLVGVAGVRADDETCIGVSQDKAKAELQKAYALEQRGQRAEAFRTAIGNAHCAGGQDLIERLGPVLGREAESQGRFDQAFAYFSRSEGVYDDAKRVAHKAGVAAEKSGKLDKALEWYRLAEDEPNRVRLEALSKMAALRQRPEDVNRFGAAFHFIEENFKSYPAQLGKDRAELRQLLEQQVKHALAAEGQAFSTGRDSVPQLELARSWLLFVHDERQALSQAEQHGDALAKRDTRRDVERALHYYRFAGATGKERQLQARAVVLGAVHEKKGEYAEAADFYSLGGATDQADALQQRKQAEQEKNEGQRKAKFSKGQKDLEKELGF